jgi:hypothetical protein
MQRNVTAVIVASDVAGLIVRSRSRANDQRTTPDGDSQQPAEQSLYGAMSANSGTSSNPQATWCPTVSTCFAVRDTAVHTNGRTAWFFRPNEGGTLPNGISYPSVRMRHTFSVVVLNSTRGAGVWVPLTIGLCALLKCGDRAIIPMGPSRFMSDGVLTTSDNGVWKIAPTGGTGLPPIARTNFKRELTVRDPSRVMGISTGWLTTAAPQFISIGSAASAPIAAMPLAVIEPSAQPLTAAPRESGKARGLEGQVSQVALEEY